MTPRWPVASGPEASLASGVPDDLVDAWEKACARVGPLIGARHEAETMRSYARRAEGQVPADAAGELRVLADALGRVLFGPGPGSP